MKSRELLLIIVNTHIYLVFNSVSKFYLVKDNNMTRVS